MKAELSLSPEDAAIVQAMFARGELADIGVVGLSIVSKPQQAKLPTNKSNTAAIPPSQRQTWSSKIMALVKGVGTILKQALDITIEVMLARPDKSTNVSRDQNMSALQAMYPIGSRIKGVITRVTFTQVIVAIRITNDPAVYYGVIHVSNWYPERHREGLCYYVPVGSEVEAEVLDYNIKDLVNLRAKTTAIQNPIPTPKPQL